MEAKDKQGRTTLHYPTMKGHEDCVRLLFEAGADKYTRRNNGRIAISREDTNGYPEIVESLLDAGTNSHINSLNGETPYNTALEKGHVSPIYIIAFILL